MAPSADRTSEVVKVSGRRSYVLIGLLGAFVLGLMWMGLQLHLRQHREGIVRDAAGNVENLALALAEQNRRTLHALDQTLRFVQILTETRPDLDAQARIDQVERLPGIVAEIAVADAHGNLLGSSRRAPPEIFGAKPADQPYFRVHREAGGPDLFIGRVARAGAGDPRLHLSRRLQGPDGAFGGVVAMALSPDVLAAPFRAIDVGRDGSVALVGLDGYLRARSRDLPGLHDRDVRTDPETAVAIGRLGRESVVVRRARSPSDGVERIMAYRALPDLGLFLSVSQSLREVLAPMRAEEASAHVYGVAASLVLILTLSLLVVQLEGRRRREAELDVKTRLLQATLDNMDQGLQMQDAEGRIVVHNRRLLDLLDLPPELMESCPNYMDLRRFLTVRGEFAGASSEIQRHTLGADLLTPDAVYERQRPNGVVLEVRGCALEGGGVLRTYTDVTAQRRAARDLAASEARYRLLAGHVTDMIVEMDLGFVRRYVSPSCREIMGYEPEELTGRHPAALIHLEDIGEMTAAAAEMSAGRLDRSTQTYRLRHREGHWIWAEAKMQLVRDADGNPVSVVTTTRDVTQRRLADLALQESEARYRLFAENASDLIIVSDGKGRRSYISPAVHRLTGYTPAEAADLRVSQIVHPEDIAALIAASRSLSEAEPEGSLVYRLLHKAGHAVWVEALFHRVIQDGNATVVTVVRDITQRRSAEQKLADETALLELTLDTMDQGLIATDAQGRIQVCNRHAVALLDLPPALMADRPTLDAVARLRPELGPMPDAGQEGGQDGGQGGQDPGQDGGQVPGRDPAGPVRHGSVVERVRPDGSVLEVRTAWSPQGSAVRTFTDITARKQAERRVEHLARHDPLTDLPNRTVLRERLDDVLARPGETAALLCLDLDRFKAVNDTLGHPVGDALLCEAGRRLQGVLQPGDTVARLGGDEFAVLQVGVAQPEGADTLARRIIEALDRPFRLEGQEVTIGGSIGVALVPRDGTDPDTLLKNADVALYRTKKDGRHAHRFFEPGMDSGMRVRRALELDLREALKRDEFVLHYQPIQDLATGRIVGCEALLRWQHPTRGLVAPGEFIEVAEEAGLIAPIGEWVLREACREAAGWPGDLRLAVNLSAVQFRRGDLLQTVMMALGAARLPAERLELEITETVLMQDDAAHHHTLHQLRRLGVSVALDDFGTGYSSLSYLRQFPFDRIKIDRSFVADIGEPDTAAIVRAIVSLGGQLGTAITAEGIETQEQLDRVRLEGCTEAQGYLIGRPQPPGDFHHWAASLRSAA